MDNIKTRSDKRRTDRMAAFSRELNDDEIIVSHDVDDKIASDIAEGIMTMCSVDGKLDKRLLMEMIAAANQKTIQFRDIQWHHTLHILTDQLAEYERRNGKITIKELQEQLRQLYPKH